MAWSLFNKSTARISLPRQQLADVGLAATYSPAVDEGHAVENNGGLILHVKNGSEDEVTVTVLSGYTRAGLKLADRVVTVPVGGEVYIGPFDPVAYNQFDSKPRQIYIDYSATEGVTVAALQM